MEKGFVENGFIIDLSDAKNTTQLVFELSSIMEHPDVKRKNVCLKLGSLDLKQSQLLSIKALIESMDASIAFIDTNSEQTEASAVSLGIIVSEISDSSVPSVGCTASEEIKENLDSSQDLSGIYVSPDPSELGIYKSFNYEIFERRNSVVVAFDGNSPVSNLIQEAKNGKGKAKIYVNSDVDVLKEKAKSLDGYVRLFNTSENLAKEILEDNPDIMEK